MFLGNMRDASDASALHRLGVGYVLNVTAKPPAYALDPGINYKQLVASDNGLQNLRQFFDEAFDFIDEAKANSSGVLIHCQAGISRSPTIAVAYLMKQGPGMAMADAYKFVKTRRSIISPNLNFMGQLWEFEQGLLQESRKKKNNSSSTESVSSGSSDPDQEEEDSNSSHSSLEETCSAPPMPMPPAATTKNSLAHVIEDACQHVAAAAAANPDPSWSDKVNQATRSYETGSL